MAADRACDYEVGRDGFRISCAPQALDLDYLFGFLSGAYWHKALTPDRLQRSIEHSIAFGLYSTGQSGRQIGFARVVSDRATFAYLADVFIDEEFQGAGLGQWLIGAVHAHPELRGLKWWLLKTRDAQSFYEKLGYREIADSGLMAFQP